VTKTYTSVSGKSAGDFITESDWDNSIAANINNLIVPPVCVAYNDASISIPNDAVTELTFNSEAIDTDGMHSTFSNTGRITIGTTGIYVATLVCSFAVNSSGLRSLYIAVDGSDYVAALDVPANSVGGASLSLTTRALALTSGQYLTGHAYQNSGGALGLAANLTSPFFSIHFVGRVS